MGYLVYTIRGALIRVLLYVAKGMCCNLLPEDALLCYNYFCDDADRKPHCNHRANRKSSGYWITNRSALSQLGYRRFKPNSILHH
jgi:hypothetical protein